MSPGRRNPKTSSSENGIHLKNSCEREHLLPAEIDLLLAEVAGAEEQAGLEAVAKAAGTWRKVLGKSLAKSTIILFPPTPFTAIRMIWQLARFVYIRTSGKAVPHMFR